MIVTHFARPTTTNQKRQRKLPILFSTLAVPRPTTSPRTKTHNENSQSLLLPSPSYAPPPKAKNLLPDKKNPPPKTQTSCRTKPMVKQPSLVVPAAKSANPIPRFVLELQTV